MHAFVRWEGRKGSHSEHLVQRLCVCCRIIRLNGLGFLRWGLDRRERLFRGLLDWLQLDLLKQFLAQSESVADDPYG
jgi:hypothetical protein